MGITGTFRRITRRTRIGMSMGITLPSTTTTTDLHEVMDTEVNQEGPLLIL